MSGPPASATPPGNTGQPAGPTPPDAASPAGTQPAGRLLWVDAGNGAAGDMLLAALLDAGADLAAVRAGLAGLRVEPVDIAPQPVRRHGLRAVLAGVHAPEGTVHRHLSDVLAVIGSAGLPAPVAAFAVAAFRRLAFAEARVHGTPVEAVHFHEVGALDAIADIVGCALALHSLGLLAPGTPRIVSPVAVGGGTVRTAHGPLPVPPPAVLELLTAAGLPVRAHEAQRELCTPTGAALLAELATGTGPVPDCRPRAVGVGAGRADPPTHPNVLRVLLGEPAAPAADRWQTADLWQVEATIDDLDPRIWPDLLEELRSAGAADAWCVPALMRKGRPGQVLCVLVDADRLDLACRVVFTRTTTLGVRVAPVTRRSLRRDQVPVPFGGSTVLVKRGYLGGELVTVQPEYDEARAAARSAGVPVAEVLAATRAAAGQFPPAVGGPGHGASTGDEPADSEPAPAGHLPPGAGPVIPGAAD